MTDLKPMSDGLAYLTPERLRHVLRYEPDTGVFTWKDSRNGSKQIGGVAGYVDGAGYVRIVVFKTKYKAHRLAWLYVYGEWPEKYIDHINGNRQDNRISNLRQATNRQNCANAARRRDNKSGIKGVNYSSSSGKWIAQIQYGGRKKHLGSFSSREAAAAAYREACVSAFGEFARFG